MPENEEKPIQVYAAAAANLVIALTKFIAALATGSSAMLSEAIHSVADTGNQLFMLLGLKRSRRPATTEHPFGYGQEVYFWGFVVAMILFSLGGLMSIYEGISRVRHPGEISDPLWNYVVLAIAAVAEGISIHFALKKFRKSVKPGESWWKALRRSKDPSVFIVVAEDAAALAGIAVAVVGISLEQVFQSVLPDAIAAMIIGVILCIVAIIMAGETHALLLGESADSDVVAGIYEIIKADSAVADLPRPLTMHFGPNEILVNVAVKFKPGVAREAVLDSIAGFESAIRRRFPQVRRIFVEVESLRKPEHEISAA